VLRKITLAVWATSVPPYVSGPCCLIKHSGNYFLGILCEIKKKNALCGEHANPTAFLPLTWFVGVLDKKFSTGREFHTNGLKGVMFYISVLRLLTDLGEIRYGNFRHKAVENLDEFCYSVCNESHTLVKDASEMFPYIRLSHQTWIQSGMGCVHKNLYYVSFVKTAH